MNGFGKSVFSWGSVNLTKKGEARLKYLRALKEADENDYSLLVRFARE